MTGDLAKAFNVPQNAGLLIQRVASNSPASRLGLKAGTLTAVVEGEKLIVGGDIILEAQGVPIMSGAKSYSVIRDRLTRLRSGDRLTVTVLREGQKRVLTMKVP